MYNILPVLDYHSVVQQWKIKQISSLCLEWNDVKQVAQLLERFQVVLLRLLFSVQNIEKTICTEQNGWTIAFECICCTVMNVTMIDF